MASQSMTHSYVLLVCPACGQESLHEEAPLGSKRRCPFCEHKFTLTPKNAKPFTVSDDAPISMHRHREIFMHQAGHLAKKGQYQKAIDMLRPLLLLHNSQSDLWFALGYCHYKVRDMEKAEAMLTTAQKLGSPNAEVVLERLHARQGAEGQEVHSSHSAGASDDDTPVPGQCACGAVLHPEGRFCHMCGRPVEGTEAFGDLA